MKFDLNMCQHCLQIIDKVGKIPMIISVEIPMLSIVYALHRKVLILLKLIPHLLYNADTLTEEIEKQRDAAKEKLESLLDVDFEKSLAIELAFGIMSTAYKECNEEVLLKNFKEEMKRMRDSMQALSIIQNLFPKNAPSKNNKV